MSRVEAGDAISLQDLVIRVANAPSNENHIAFSQALPTATVFVKLVGVPGAPAASRRFSVSPGGSVRVRYARLPSAWRWSVPRPFGLGRSRRTRSSQR